MAKPKWDDGDGGAYLPPSSSLDFIASGCTVLDLVLGGGWPLGRIANIVGDKSTGKTLLAIEACANFVRAYPRGRILYAEAESAFDLSYARSLGLPERNIDVVQDVDTVEALFSLLGTFADARLKFGQPGLFVIDSLDALSDESEMGRAVGEGSYGTAKAKQMSQLFRRLVRKLERAKVALMIISQVRDNIGVTFGRKYTRSGGRALDFYASQVVYLAQIKMLNRTIDKVERPVGVRVRAKCTKSKVSLPYRECEFDIKFGYGTDDVTACTDWLASVGAKPAKGLSADDLRERVREEWAEIEAKFSPKERKYT